MKAKAKVDPDPFDEGCRAAGDGIPAEANPYPAGSGKYALWQDGHEVGAQALNQDKPRIVDDFRRNAAVCARSGSQIDGTGVLPSAFP